ncbi:MAG: dihydropyrimidinase [Chloroflexi bacterium]|nr:dihydropyrimidinase [Chloroflexota bacterium]
MTITAAPRFDLVIRGGTVVRADRSLRADVGVRDGRISALEAAIPVEAAGRVIDAHGLLVLPGVIDVHTHTRIATDDEPDRFFQDTRAAAFGGTTTLLAFDNPGTGISEGVAGSALAAAREWLDRTRGDAAIDVGLSAVLTAQQTDPAAELAALVDLGVASGKCFLVYDFGVDEARLAELLRASRAAGMLLQVHCEDRAMLDKGIAEQLAAGEDGPRGHARSRPPACEATGTARAIALAATADAPAYLVHVSSRAAVAAITRARAAGQPVFGETCPHYLVLDASRYERPRTDAMAAIISPPLRSLDDQAAMWDALVAGDLDLVATDHVPDRLDREKRDEGQPFPVVSNGAPGVETLLAVTWGAAPAGRMTPERMVDVLATTPARLFGMPTKGAIEVGRDADLVVFDPAARRTIRQADLHHASDFTPYEGLEVTGAIREVVAGGRSVVRDGMYLGTRGDGRYVARSLG